MEIQTDHIVPTQNDSEEQAQQLNNQLHDQLRDQLNDKLHTTQAQEEEEGIQEQTRRQKRRRLYFMFDEDTEMTNEEILEMRESVHDDLDEAERVAKEKVYK